MLLWRWCSALCGLVDVIACITYDSTTNTDPHVDNRQMSRRICNILNVFSECPVGLRQIVPVSWQVSAGKTGICSNKPKSQQSSCDKSTLVKRRRAAGNMRCNDYVCILLLEQYSFSCFILYHSSIHILRVLSQSEYAFDSRIAQLTCQDEETMNSNQLLTYQYELAVNNTTCMMNECIYIVNTTRTSIIITPASQY